MTRRPTPHVLLPVLILFLASCASVASPPAATLAALSGNGSYEVMTYTDFVPYHQSSQSCDEAFSGLDSILAGVSTFMAYFFFWPACHMVLSVFTPGLPEGVSFPKFKWNWSKWRYYIKFESEELQNEMELVDLSKIKARKRLTIGHDTRLSEQLQDRASMIKNMENGGLLHFFYPGQF